MDRDLLETQWVQAREFLRDKWSNLTEEDLRQINGRYDQLSDKLQQRYGYSREQAEEEINRWNLERTPRSTSYTRTGREQGTERPSYVRPEDNNVQKEEGSSFLKWLLALAIPLLLLAGYFGTTATTNEKNIKPVEDSSLKNPADASKGKVERER